MGKTNIEITILGCGGSGGTPLACGHWGCCDPNETRNNRTRPSIAIRTAETCVVIDTGPDFRQQTLRENLSVIDAIIYSHPHADHINGIDDVRYAAVKRRINGDSDFKMPTYAENATLDKIKEIFPYMFKTSDDGLYVPLLDTNIIDYGQSIQIKDISIQTFVQTHGSGHSMGFKVGDIGYSTDVSQMTSDGLNTLKGISTWIVDCGQYGQDDDELTVHPNLERVLEWNNIIGADKLFLTHLTPRQDYITINNETPDYIECAYDGLKLITSL